MRSQIRALPRPIYDLSKKKNSPIAHQSSHTVMRYNMMFFPWIPGAWLPWAQVQVRITLVGAYGLVIYGIKIATFLPLFPSSSVAQKGGGVKVNFDSSMKQKDVELWN